jgi:hypothetical protein
MLGIALWFAGTLFHVSLWWSLGVPRIPPILPFANLAIVPLCFWLSWQLTLAPNGLSCPQCRGVGSGGRLVRPASAPTTIIASASE